MEIRLQLVVFRPMVEKRQHFNVLIWSYWSRKSSIWISLQLYWSFVSASVTPAALPSCQRLEMPGDFPGLQLDATHRCHRAELHPLTWPHGAPLAVLGSSKYSAYNKDVWEETQFVKQQCWGRQSVDNFPTVFQDSLNQKQGRIYMCDLTNFC